jgi:hypothetical protein
VKTPTPFEPEIDQFPINLLHNEAPIH